MVNKPNNVKQKELRGTTFMLVQQLDPTMWDWNTNEKKELNKGIGAILDVLCERLGLNTKKFNHQIELYGIVHDKDIQTARDSNGQVIYDKNDKPIISSKTPHVHINIFFKKRARLTAIAKLMGVNENNIQVGKGRYAKENWMAYLVHAKDSNKFQYDPTEVATRTYDPKTKEIKKSGYMEYYGEHYEAWKYRQSTAKHQRNLVKVDWLVEKIAKGELTKDQILLTDDYADVYLANMQKINEAFQFRTEMAGVKTAQLLKEGKIALSVFFITGEPGSGKTYFAQQFIQHYLDKHPDWSYYQAANKNPFDDYRGEQIVYMDEARSDTLDPNAWLLFLDPRQMGNIGARYQNKRVAARVIIITAYESPYKFFGYMKGSGGTNEALSQFIRRLSMIAKIVPYDKIRENVELSAVARLHEPKKIDLGTDRHGEPVTRSIKHSDIPLGKYTIDDAIDLITNKVDRDNDQSIKHPSEMLPFPEDIENALDVDKFGNVDYSRIYNLFGIHGNTFKQVNNLDKLKDKKENKDDN